MKSTLSTSTDGAAAPNAGRLCRSLLVLGLLVLPGWLGAQSSDEVSYSRDGADSCLSCHDDAPVLELFRTPHAVPSDTRSPFGSGQLQCESCHGPGGPHSARVRRNEVRPPIINFGSDEHTEVSIQNEICTSCHEPEVGFAWHNGAHAINDVACADCHVSHATEDAVLHTSTQPDVCFDCHVLQRNETLKAFAHPIAEGEMDCGSCHNAHGDSVGEQLARLTINDTCNDCHAEKRGPWLWEHAPVAEDCGSCHAPHGSNHPGMLTSRAPLLCQSCHSQSGHPSITQTPGGLAGAMASQYLLGQSCLNCHGQVHGSNHPSGSRLNR